MMFLQTYQTLPESGKRLIDFENESIGNRYKIIKSKFASYTVFAVSCGGVITIGFKVSIHHGQTHRKPGPSKSVPEGRYH
jgi:hypothetical protein